MPADEMFIGRRKTILLPETAQDLVRGRIGFRRVNFGRAKKEIE